MSALEALQSQIASGLRDNFTDAQRAKMVADLAELLGVRSVTVGVEDSELNDETKEKILRDLAKTLGVQVATTAQYSDSLSCLRAELENIGAQLSAACSKLDRLS